MLKTILKIALPLPLPQLYDYLPPADCDVESLQPGQRLLLPFGNRELVGVLVRISADADINPEKIKAAIKTIESKPSLTPELLKLCQWAAGYYHHALGEILSAALPLRYRKDEAREELREHVWVHTTEGLGLPADALKRSKKQQTLHQWLLSEGKATVADCKRLKISGAVTKALEEKGLIKPALLDIPPFSPSQEILASPALALNKEQSDALAAIRYHAFRCYLLHGVTGSGKTEVYMQLIARTLQTGKQVLVLIPEIGLSPQTLARFRARFKVEIAELHSRVSEVERAQNWEKARSGVARIILGTRLAALTPLADPGLIIVDEEHDPSFKQQDGFRYSARDLSIYRASQLKIPIVLGSATPSLESLNHALQGRYTHLRLRSRAGQAIEPHMQVLDLRDQPLQAGLAESALEGIRHTLEAGKQALVFLNRRGYAPLLFCQSCGWQAKCQACELNFTLHQHPARLHCHHCDARRALPRQCPQCKHSQLLHNGVGTEQVVENLKSLFTHYPVLRIDRDTTRNKQDFSKLLQQIHDKDAAVLVGTQMLAKGHHFSKLDLVVVMDTDQGLMSSDFKALERLGQLTTQVAGRAGREEQQGTVLLQSYQPEHPLLQCLIHEGYEHFAQRLLNSRQQAKLPPFTYSALLRAESKRGENAMELLAALKRKFLHFKTQANCPALRVLGPFPAPIEKVQNRFRFQLQLFSDDRAALHRSLDFSITEIQSQALAKRVRWSVDVDPGDYS